jgi:hypothetical protein
MSIEAMVSVGIMMIIEDIVSIKIIMNTEIMIIANGIQMLNMAPGVDGITGIDTGARN